MEESNKFKSFTTSDGIYICKGDRFFGINSNLDKFPSIAGDLIHLSEGWHKTFSTEEKADEYIILNKPCLTLKEIVDISGNTPLFNSEIKQLVKSKIKL